MQWYSVCTEDRKGWTLKVSLFSVSYCTFEVFFFKKNHMLASSFRKITCGYSCGGLAVWVGRFLHFLCGGLQSNKQPAVWFKSNRMWRSTGSRWRENSDVTEGMAAQRVEAALRKRRDTRAGYLEVADGFLKWNCRHRAWGVRIYSSEDVSTVTFYSGLLGKLQRTYSVGSNGELTQHWYPLRWEREQNLTKLIDEEHSPE